MSRFPLLSRLRLPKTLARLAGSARLKAAAAALAFGSTAAAPAEASDWSLFGRPDSRTTLNTATIRGQQPYAADPYAADPFGADPFAGGMMPQPAPQMAQTLPPSYDGSGINPGAPLSSPTPTYDPFSGTVPPAAGFDPYGAGLGGEIGTGVGTEFGTDGYDPLLNGYRADPFNPYVNTPGGGLNSYGRPKTEAFGINGPQPYRYGWREKMDLAFNSKVGTSDPDIGGFSIGEFNAIKGWSGLGPRGWTLTVNPELNYRWLEGPSGPPGLPASLWRFGAGLSFATPIDDGFSLEMGVTPRIATDFGQSFNSHTWQFDAHATGNIQLRPDLLFIFGFQYWDRVDDIFLPLGGLVWQASDMVEVRATFPRASIDIFLGTPFGAPTWLYVNSEYRVESYSVGLESPFADGQTVRADSIQIEDWRLMLGTRWESGWLVSFVEGGIILGRDVEFARGGTGVGDFDVDPSFLGRFGFKW